MGLLVIGLLIGLIAGSVMNDVTVYSYKKTLVMKSECEIPECIRGELYYIVPESEYNGF